MQIRKEDFSELRRSIAEMEQLTTQPSMNGRERARFNFLLAKTSLLKQGVSSLEIDAQQAGVDYRTLRGPLTPEQREEYRAWRAYVDATVEHRDVVKGDFTPGTYTDLGFFVPTEFFYDQLPKAMRQYDAILDSRVATIVETKNARPIQIPLLDDVAHPADLLSESDDDSEVDIAGTSIALGGFAFRTPKILFSLEWAQDVEAGYGLMTILQASAAIRLALGTSRYATTGNGSGQPVGIVPAAIAAGATVSAQGTSAIVRKDLENLYYSVDPAYRGSACWLANDKTIQTLRALADTVTRPLLDLDRGGNAISPEGLQIFGKPVLVSPSMDDVGASKHPLLFGNCKYFVIRRATNDNYMRIYKEGAGLIEKGLLAARFFQRFDSNLLVPASGSAVKVLRMTS